MGITKRGKDDLIMVAGPWYILSNVMFCPVIGGEMLWQKAQDISFYLDQTLYNFTAKLNMLLQQWIFLHWSLLRA